jgi:hypothetical protein
MHQRWCEDEERHGKEDSHDQAVRLAGVSSSGAACGCGVARLRVGSVCGGAGDGVAEQCDAARAGLDGDRAGASETDQAAWGARGDATAQVVQHDQGIAPSLDEKETQQADPVRNVKTSEDSHLL